ncbi:acetyl-CoA carboxylase biotin carboxyl carrier protein [Paraburkholderia fungorum]|uniref:acetyl-CoA carboxylase biotin carboxyl carrier protein n=1 Tax=Paraburkholderia fungorum TaxID=134537 RepID=UPI002091F308|nr:acetyl-CoA carboxylase biotin carboxyl carrier protein [Paraburkholderia fungorum]USU18882.1 acetyl-CoA carboxylase biotin carboxyl carrier protein [Paraburkholderia fungorum]USU29122.1 acetyl-CoA carboxylase biotin carboxyl carrier protein [Paraburkholderia fungorum]
MDHEKLNRLLQLVEGTSIAELEYGEGDWRIKLTRAPGNGQAGSPAAAQPAVAESLHHGRDDTAGTPDAAASQGQRHVVTAGMTGTFYRAPAPDQPAFVSVGDVVKEGQTIAVVEAMKLLNALEADCEGRLVEIFVEDGVAVSPDTRLFAIEPLEVANV